MSDVRTPPGKHKSLFAGNKKWYWIGGSVGAIALFYYYEKQKSSAAAAASAATTADTSGTNTTDNSGYDTSYPSDAYGYSDYGYGDTGGGAYLGSYTDPSTGTVITGGGTTTGTGTQTITAPTTNAQWAQQAIAYLTQEGYDPVATAAAIGAYLLGLGLTNDQMGIVQAALAVEGNPPQTVPAPHVAAPGGQSGGSGTTGGGSTGGPTQLQTPALAVLSVDKSAKRAVLGWTPIPNTNFYQLNLGVPGASYVYARVEGNSTTVTKPGSYHIYAVPAGNQTQYTESHYSNSVTVSF